MIDEQLETQVRMILFSHKGKENPIERWEMVRNIFGTGTDLPRSDNNVYDRRIRDVVEHLRPSLLICDMADGRGRYLATSWTEYVEFHKRYIKRAWPIIKTANAMFETAKQAYVKEYEEWKRGQEQPRLFDVDDVGSLSLMRMR